MSPKQFIKILWITVTRGNWPAVAVEMHQPAAFGCKLRNLPARAQVQQITRQRETLGMFRS